ncbi:macro domain-containing protein [Aeromonas dhakensis]|uniref:macro domain-containing protein n=1 Tax=Aeromonas dhakensis TaxID=196024 RepID=UPI002B46FE8C|nr:macro domain-containing protein [Aeromonas dhakensis]
MDVINGDLLRLALGGRFDVIIHGCNCFCVMDDGIAKTIKSTFPEAYHVDCETKVADKGKLGSYSLVKVVRGDVSFYLINAYTQYDYRGTEVHVNYDAIKTVFDKINSEFDGFKIAYPKIGAGLGGGNWAVIKDIIDSSLVNQSHTLVNYKSE